MTTYTEPESVILGLLLTRLQALSLTPAMPIAEPGLDYTPPEDRKYLRVQHMPNTTLRPFIGSFDPDYYHGIFQVTVVWPVNQPEQDAREIAGKVADHFRQDTKMASADGEIVVRSTRRPAVASSMPDGADLLTPVSVSYESYI